MVTRGIAELANKFRQREALLWSGKLFRWISSEYALPEKGPDTHDCPTAGSFMLGGRMNAKGTYGVLYTAPRLEVAALEVTKFVRSKVGSLDQALEKTARFLQENRYQLFEINAKELRVLDLSTDEEVAKRLLASPIDPITTCTDEITLTPSQELGFAAFLAGYEGVLRPSVYLWKSWDVQSLVLDVFCPNLTHPLTWHLVV